METYDEWHLGQPLHVGFAPRPSLTPAQEEHMAQSSQERAERRAQERLRAERQLSRAVTEAEQAWKHYRRMFRFTVASMITCLLLGLASAATLTDFGSNMASFIATIVFLLGTAGALIQLCNWHYEHNSSGQLQRAVNTAQAAYDDHMYEDVT